MNDSVTIFNTSSSAKPRRWLTEIINDRFPLRVM